MNDDPALASLSLTHVTYNPDDPISYLSAWLALVPQGLCAIYVTLIWATREVEILLMFAGQMGCEAFNFALKRWFKEERPKQIHGNGYGMPSSHAQFTAFFSVSLTLWLLLRHSPTPTTSYSPSTLLERFLVSVAACVSAGAVAASRVYLNYHTPRQVLVGVGAGVTLAIVYFIFTTILRRFGWIDWALGTYLARKARIRDLITTEDIQDAGWRRFEERRQERMKRQGTSVKKTI